MPNAQKLREISDLAFEALKKRLEGGAVQGHAHGENSYQHSSLSEVLKVAVEVDHMAQEEAACESGTAFGWALAHPLDV